MSILTTEQRADVTTTAGRGSGRLPGIALMTGSAASNQFGAATAALAFPVLGPAGVVAIRQWVAGAVLLVTVRPKFASFTWRQWQPVLALALIFATMNLSLYVAIDRIGLGLAVTLESSARWRWHCSPRGASLTSAAPWSRGPPSSCWPGRSRAPITPASP
jgi:inner membrane transporter RhtA